METHEVHLTAAVVHFVQELRVGSDVFLLRSRGERELTAMYYAGSGGGVNVRSEVE